MRAYVRSQSPSRFEVVPEAARGPGPGGPPSLFPAGWPSFARELETASQEADRRLKPSLERVAHCGGLSVARGYDCGNEDETLSAWCGHAFCPACAQREGAHAARFVREEWDARVYSVQVRCGGELSSPLLPGQGEVAEIRAAWARITREVAAQTGFTRLGAIPRVLVAPQSVTLFARVPFDLETVHGEIAAEELTHSLRQACRQAGFRGEVALVSREEAATSIKAGLGEQARRFAVAVSRDLGRRAETAWRAGFPADATQEATAKASAKRWIGHFEAAHQERRRKRFLGGKDSLPAPESVQPQEEHASCSVHGGHCHVIVTRVRERQSGQLVIAYPGDQIPSSSRTQVAEFFATAAEEGVRAQPAEGLRHGQEAIERRMRRAG